jgi:cysteinyl-tRNA synthetase
VIGGLLTNRYAYHLGNDVYFDITRSSAYGILSGKKIDELQAGARVEVNEKKRNPGDFVLWKGNKDNLFWQSPWGYGRPGWHIECSAMSYAYLGETLDIHAGGADLIFPHHENEIAQSEGFTGKKFVNYWLHNAFVNVDNEKMSKSLGNSVTLRYIAEQYDPMILRFYFLQHHYRTPLDFSFDRLASALPAYKKLVSLCGEAAPEQPLMYQDVIKHPLAYEMVQALADDCNVPRMIGLIFEHSEAIRNDYELKRAVASLLTHVTGLRLIPIADSTAKVTPEIEALLKEREQARADKNWHKADQLRDRLRQLGYTVQDKKSV